MGVKFDIDYINSEGAFGTLHWDEKGLSTGAVSGPYGRGELVEGLYHCYRSKLLDKDSNFAFCDSLQNCWMQVIDPQFSTERKDLGIHPDGNRLGTLGCIGILDSDTKAWYDAFRSVGQGEFVTLEVSK